MFAIKFVWRRNLCDKTLAVIPKKFWLILLNVTQTRALVVFLAWVFLCLLINWHIFASFHSSFVLLSKFVVTNKFNYKNNLIIFCSIRTLSEGAVMKQIVKSFYLHILFLPLFMCLWHLEYCLSLDQRTAWNNRDKVLCFITIKYPITNCFSPVVVDIINFRFLCCK